MSIVERAVARSDSADPGRTGAVQDLVPTVTKPEFDQRRVTTDASLTARDLKPIVQLDFGRLRETGRLPPEESTRQADDEFRRIKWPLLSRIADHEGTTAARNNVILVTSALPGEGKTFVSLNLALSVVRDRELRVILVDADVARPGLTPSLSLDNRPGLTDVLENADLEVSAVTYQTNVEGLLVVPAGKWNDKAPEFFAGRRMPQVIQDLIHRAGNGVVILDSPPLLATNEAQVATRHVGQVLLVVRADQTEQRAVQDAIALVDKSTSMSAVLNAAKPSFLGRYYGGYTYKYGYGDTPKVARSRGVSRESQE